MPNFRQLALIMLLIWPPLALAGQQANSQDLKQDTQHLAKDLKSYGANQRDKAMADIRNTLKLFDNRIDQLSSELSRNWDKMSAQGREQAKKNLADLRAQRDKVKGWMNRLQDSSSKRWDDIRQGFSNALDGLSKAWDNTRKSLEKDNRKEKTQSQGI